MKELNDMEHFVLQPGESLILRTRRHLSQEQMHRLHELVAGMGCRTLILGPDIEVFAGNIEVVEPMPSEEDIIAARAEIEQHYADGGFVQFQIDPPNGEWYDAQKGYLPIGEWKWDCYSYRVKCK